MSLVPWFIFALAIVIKLVLKKAPENRLKISAIGALTPCYFVKHYFHKLIIFYTIKQNLHTPILLPIIISLPSTYMVHPVGIAVTNIIWY